jgi:hypothetical protein
MQRKHSVRGRRACRVFRGFVCIPSWPPVGIPVSSFTGAGVTTLSTERLLLEVAEVQNYRSGPRRVKSTAWANRCGMPSERRTHHALAADILSLVLSRTGSTDKGDCGALGATSRVAAQTCATDDEPTVGHVACIPLLQILVYCWQTGALSGLLRELAMRVVFCNDITVPLAVARDAAVAMDGAGA